MLRHINKGFDGSRSSGIRRVLMTLMSASLVEKLILFDVMWVDVRLKFIPLAPFATDQSSQIVKINDLSTFVPDFT
jgi:hypothetical protein